MVVPLEIVFPDGIKELLDEIQKPTKWFYLRKYFRMEYRRTTVRWNTIAKLVFILLETALELLDEIQEPSWWLFYFETVFQDGIEELLDELQEPAWWLFYLR
jgi:hypothetical protein